MSKIKAIFFDLDGTLINLSIDWHKTKAILSEGKKVSGSNVSLGELLSTDKDHALLRQIEADAIKKANVPEGVTEALLYISKKYKIAIVSRNYRHTIELFIDKAGLKNTGIRIVGKEDVEYLKPHPEALELLLQEFKCLPSEAMMIGDTDHDLGAANAAGVNIVLINPKFADTSNARVIGSIKELMEIL